MGFDIFANSDNFESLAGGLVLPVLDGCDSFFLPNTSIKKSVKNWAGKRDGILGGAPVIQPGFTSFEANSLAYMETPSVESNQMTLLYAGRGTTDSSTEDLSPVFVSSRTAPAALGQVGGVQIYPNAPGSLRLYFSQWDGTKTVNTTSSVNSYAPGAWQFVVGRIGATSHSIRNMTTGIIGNEVALVGNRNPGSGKIRIGSMFDATWKGKSDAAFMAKYNRALSDIEILAIYLWVQDYLAGYGIAV